MTLDTNGHNLSCTDLTLKDRGIFLGGSGTHTISGSLDAVATDSDFDPETSTVILGGTNQNIQLNADDSFYDLAIQSNDTNCLTSINVTHDLYFIDREPLMSYTVDNATDTLGEYDANDAGEIHLGIIILGIGNDYSTSLIPFILEILSTPEIIAYISIDYLYEVLTNAPAAAVINATSNASFILVYDSGVWGTPEVYQMGSYWVNVSAEYAGQEVYQNYTLEVVEDVMDYGLIIGLGFGSLIALIGYFNRGLLFFSGITWVVIGLVAFLPHGEMFMIITDAKSWAEYHLEENYTFSFETGESEPPIVLIDFPPNGTVLDVPFVEVTGVAEDNAALVTIGYKIVWDGGENNVTSMVDPPELVRSFNFEIDLH